MKKKIGEIWNFLFVYINWAIGPPTIGIGWIILFLLLACSPLIVELIKK